MVGIDEVGRGCLAGPLLVVAARATAQLPKLRDSKSLSKAQRQGLFNSLIEACLFGEGWVSSSEIDKQGLTEAMKSGVARALKNLGVSDQEEIILDGNYNYLPVHYKNFQCIIKADQSIAVVSAASIYAKVRRDLYMKELAKKHPHYLFDSHAGYGTKAHYRALKEYGPLEFVHRTSFALTRTLS